jgi:hypothetical protein
MTKSVHLARCCLTRIRLVHHDYRRERRYIDLLGLPHTRRDIQRITIARSSASTWMGRTQPSSA